MKHALLRYIVQFKENNKKDRYISFYYNLVLVFVPSSVSILKIFYPILFSRDSYNSRSRFSRAARFVSGDHRHQSSVSVMMEKLQWPTLEHWRKNQRLTTMFKIVHGLVAVPTSSLIPADPHTRCNHQYKFKCISASTTAYKESFYPEQFPSGTNFTKKIAEVTSINCFKSRLH